VRTRVREMRRQRSFRHPSPIGSNRPTADLRRRVEARRTTHQNPKTWGAVFRAGRDFPHRALFPRFSPQRVAWRVPPPVHAAHLACEHFDEALVVPLRGGGATAPS
jgi:hypothetical protein